MTALLASPATPKGTRVGFSGLHTPDLTPQSPTERAYTELEGAYDYYNRVLFGGELPPCLITLQRKGPRVMGYFSAERFGTERGDRTDEIALNPLHFRGAGLGEVLQTLVHEMAHLWQFHFGQKGRRGYHNKEWGQKMKQVGLYPSSTGRPGGRETGEHMSDYVIEGGLFERATQALVAQGFMVSWYDVLGLSSASGVPGVDGPTAAPSPAAPAPTRAKFRCPRCRAQAWGKPLLRLVCGDCMVPMPPV